MISIDSLGFGYKKHQPVLQQITMDVPAGHSVGVLGANGVGKTTLLRLLSGTLSPTEGRLDVLGHRPRDRSVDFYQQIHVVPEEYELPYVTGAQYLQRFSCFYPDFDHQRFAEIVDSFELNVDRSLNDMSFGQKKKFVVAFGLATGSKLILLDEPTNGMDIPSKTVFRDAIIKHQRPDQTLMISTHQVRDLESIIDSVLLMNQSTCQWLDLTTLSDSIHQIQGPVEGDVIYSEPRMGAQLSLAKGQAPFPTEIDLELLFNAFHYNLSGLIDAVSGTKEVI